MDAGSLVALTGSEPSWKNAGLKNASSGSAHKKRPVRASCFWSGGINAAMIHHQLAINLAAIHGQIPGVTQTRTGAELYPLQLPELPINRATHTTMPKHGKHVVSFADVETIEIHRKKPGG